MHISLKSILLPATLVLLALTSCGKKQSIRLVTEDVTKGSISETVTATGTLESVTSVDVGTQVTGIIDNILVDFNSEVKKGQLIAEIDKVLLQSELTSAEANVKSAKASYDYAKTNYERDKSLHDKKLISDYEFDTTRRDYEVAKTSYEKSVADRVRAAKNLTYAEIYSPIDGIVISRDVEVGQTVVSSMTVANLFTIADLDHMRVVANVDEADIGRVKEGQQVTFTVDAYPDEVFHGTVTQKRISPTTESNVVTYEVLVSANNEDHKLIPGLTANLTIYMLNESDVTLVPAKATRFIPHSYPDAKNLPALPADADTQPYNDPSDPDKKRVWLVKDNTLTPVFITVGASDGVNYRVISGLEPGTKVAVEYSVESTDDDNAPQGGQSPFQPKRPGGNKK
ncbi:MAG: efflux RND transporter periplasmic adaptor subunit [Duncaniella sp.]|uniref:efflux RND transporter periplasmic adaptor subunit n=1 Tax=Duncaniella sp. TaxID=2518496 RepID=UPI0023CDCFD3|nr:efflux RND transporter periplasmic adaptor subunit [Duncaniella sp.]MDE6089555.1 efflux RND transporter periplasmic adaptor subunit [Duncaniella sp.]